MEEGQRQAILAAYLGMRRSYDTLADEIKRLWNPAVDPSVPADAIYTVTHRLKGEDRLIEKLEEEESEGQQVTPDNFPSLVKDLLGMRIVCLRLSDVERVEQFLQYLADEGRLRFLEGPEEKKTFVLRVDPHEDVPDGIDLQYSGYSSLHYLIALGEGALGGLRAELQVRTLLEEAWGELDHKYRYELARSGVQLPDLVNHGFYSFAAYLQAASLQAEYLCMEVDKLRTPQLEPAIPETEPSEPTHVPPSFAQRVERLRPIVRETVGFEPTRRTLNYITKRLEESGLRDEVELLRDEILAPEVLAQFASAYREIADREPFTDEDDRDVDLINALNFGLFRRSQGDEVSAAGARDVLVRRFRTNPPQAMLPAEMLATRVEELAAQRRQPAPENAAALDSLAVYLVSLGMVGTDARANKIDLLIPSFRDRQFPTDATRQLLLDYQEHTPESHEHLLERIVELETGTHPRSP